MLTPRSGLPKGMVTMCVVVTALAVPALVWARGEKAVEATSWGKVVGRVHDAETRAPLDGAEVVVQQEGEFADKGRCVAKTNVKGQYTCGARLGRVSDSFDLGRFLNTGLIGLLGGGAKKVTKRVDITRLNVRVTHDGYRTFEGSVPCRSVDASKFTVAMEPILLTKATSSEVATVAEGWGAVRVLDVAVDPPILRPRDKATLIARLECPPVARPRMMKVQCRSPIFGLKRLTPASDEEGDETLMVCSVQFTAPKAKKARNERLVVWVEQCPYDVTAGWETASTLVQVVTSDDEEKAAELRLAAHSLREGEDNPQALAKLKELCELPQATIEDFRLLAEVSQMVHEHDTAVSAMQRVLEMTPKAERVRSVAGYAKALLLSEQPQRVINHAVPVVSAIKEKARPSKVPLGLMAAIGTAYVQLGNLEEAEALNAQLNKLWGKRGAASTPAVSEFRRELRLARTETALAATPDDAKAWADYGRVLLDVGRWEEGAEKLRRAVELDAGLPAVQWDLGYALLHIHGAEQAAEQSFEQALAEAEKQVEGPKGKPTTKDFFAWHRLALLLYRKACQQREAGHAEAAATIQRCKDSLIEALKCARAGADVSEGQYSYTFGYMSPKVVAISGFAYPEANDDYLLYDSLTTLQSHSDDYLALFGVVTALIDLGQVDLAVEALDQCVALKPDFSEGRYARALIAMQKGEMEAAAAELQELVKVNPRHPHANLKLAELRAAEGDMAAAAACLAAHARYYPNAQ